MKKTGLAALILIAFLIGCGTSTAVQQLLVPPARAQTNPQRFEYHCVKIFRMEPEELGPMFSKLGAEGWELSIPIAMVQGQTLGACFKRPL